MKNSTILVLAAAGLSAAAVIAIIAARRTRDAAGELEQIPELIEGCFERLHELEREIHRLKPDTAASS
ncbi:MAG: hypothetical protein ACK47B_03395 [Armatimonadota bacterium]